MIKVAHISDTHIRNLKYHYEYKEVFETLYKQLKNEKPDLIVHTGDIAHTKTQISPEYVALTSEFLLNLADIAPLYILLGNHDGNLRNNTREDAVSPIVRALNHKDIFLLKKSGEYDTGKGIVFSALSVFDDEKSWVLDPTDKTKINIALYHGAISQVKIDTGWVLEYGDHPPSIFKEFDYAMLGDIHKTNQSVDEEERYRYAGSTVQQNHGETNDKGFLIWEIQDKDKFNVRHITIPNPKPFVSITLTEKGRIPKNVVVPQNSRIRLLATSNFSFDVMKRAIDVAKTRFKPEAVSYLNKSMTTGSHSNNASIVIEDLRNIKVQEKLIKKFLETYSASDEVLEKVVELNRKYNSKAEANEDVMRNINWKIVDFEWDNLFNYGVGNSVNFQNINGVVGIFGKNYSGKSSIVDSLIWTIYNTTSKNERKNFNIINQNRNFGRGKVKILVGTELYIIERQAIKYKKKLAGVVSDEAKTIVDFMKKDTISGDRIMLNGIDRRETEKNIRKVFGAIEDFLLTSMTHQFGSLMFINEGSTKRKELFARFLDLEMFDQKYRMAKEDAADTRGALRKLEGFDYDEAIKEAEVDLQQNIKAIQKLRQSELGFKEDIEELKKELEDINDKLSKIPKDAFDMKQIKRELERKRARIETIEGENDKLIKLIDEYKEKQKELEAVIDESFDIQIYREKREDIQRWYNNIKELERKNKTNASWIDAHQKELKILEDVPCGDEFPTCPFINKASEASKHIKKYRNSIEETKDRIKVIEEQLQKLEELYPQEHRNQFDLKNQIKSDLSRAQLKLQKNKTSLAHEKNSFRALKEKVGEYEENKEIYDNIDSLELRATELKSLIEETTLKKEKTEANILRYVQENGSRKQKLEDVKSRQQDLFNLREEYEAYDLFLKCCHADGIASDIIKSNLPIINSEIAKVLANVVDFEIFFVIEGRRLNIMIKHPKHSPRPIEMGSGAEKSVSAMAIRLAFVRISSLPIADIFVLDEPGTEFDEETMEGFVRILSLIKNYFKTIILISHLETLKDCVDLQILIDKKSGGYAYVKQ